MPDVFEVEIQEEFSAAHFLRGYPGDCSKLHGHNWLVSVMVASNGLDDLGMAIDFRVLRATVDEVLGKLDHSCLNELEAFAEKNPTSENIAKYVFDELAIRLARKGLPNPTKVSVRESPGATATYSPNP